MSFDFSSAIESNPAIIDEAFATADANGDGKLSADELGSALYGAFQAEFPNSGC